MSDDLKRDLVAIFDSYREGDFSESDVDYSVCQLLTPENVHQIVDAYPDELKPAFTKWLSDPTFGEEPFASGQGPLAIPQAAILAARTWARRPYR